MDAIRKKMQSLKAETDKLLNTIAKYENDAKEANEGVTRLTVTSVILARNARAMKSSLMKLMTSSPRSWHCLKRKRKASKQLRRKSVLCPDVSC